MRLLVCGGRDFADKEFVFATLDRTFAKRPITVLIRGAARGADSLAGAWAEERGIEVEAYRANWDRDGRAAGPIRNQRMLDEGRPEAIIAFPGGRGTAHMVKIAQQAGLPVWQAVSA